MSRTLTPLWVFYDGACDMCSRSVAWALARDSRGLLRAEPAQSPAAAARLGTRAGAALGALHVWSEDRGVERGSDAVAALLARLPGWGAIAAVLASPLVRPFARVGYRVVAANRHILGAPACEVPRR